jgi:DNA polymerase I-like protein with 3'-5' exonuclease and polymerase domains/uracil-DNA glycosylase
MPTPESANTSKSMQLSMLDQLVAKVAPQTKAPTSTPWTAPPFDAIQARPMGHTPRKLMIVTEAPSVADLKVGLLGQGPSGHLLETTLKQLGLPLSAVFLTSVLRYRPYSDDPETAFALKLKDRTPEHKLVDEKWASPAALFGRQLLLQEVEECQPDLVITLGNVSMWALTGLWGARKWRSSILPSRGVGKPYKVIPTYSLTAVLREYPLRQILLHDFRRALTELETGPIVEPPNYQFIIRPGFEQAKATLVSLLIRLAYSPTPVKLSADIETRAGHTACFCIAWSTTEAICIPWMCVERLEGFWSVDEEVELIELTQAIWRHPNASLTWQNGAYDHQYEYRWHFVLPSMGFDTMVAQHSMFSISPKSLDHLSSLYCAKHRYWKDDGRNWDPSSMPEEQYWGYNCEDGVRTFEIRERQEEAIEYLTANGWPRLREVIDFQHRLQPAVVRMMLRGVRSDDVSRARLDRELSHRMGEIQAEIEDICGQPLNLRSPKQMTEFFYDILGLTPVYNRNPDGTRGNPTCDDEALLKIQGRMPLLQPLIARIQAMRSAGVFHSTFVLMRRDSDGRLRCSYNIAGTKTYRFSSSENAFNSGGNLQNIPSGDDEEAPSEYVPLPNIRKLFLFDRGMTGFDIDGDSADLRIVTGESGCRQMQAYFAAKAKPYVEIAKEFYRDPTITKHHPSYKRMKALCHGTNYGGEAPGLSDRIGLPVADIERMQKWYFGMCPEIKAWQEDIKHQIVARGYIENPFGYRLYNWDRPSRKLFNEALAWTPQSTVGILINRQLLAIDQTMPDTQLLLQVHDSLTGQFPTEHAEARKAELLAIASSVEIPCKSGTITVPAGMKTSAVSWGDCE